MSELEPWKRGYIAGIVDGEGTPRIQYSKKSNSYTPVLRIVNTNLPLLEALRNMVGEGGLHQLWSKEYFLSKINKRHNRKMVYEYTLCSRSLKRILPQIIDYLIVKREQAKVIINFFSSSTFEEKESLFLEIKRLNRREKRW